MSKIVRMESKDGVESMKVAFDHNESPPPEGWQRTDGAGAGNDACIVEGLLVRGMDSSHPFMMFAYLSPEVNRQDLSHEQDIAGILEHSREHGITVEPGETFDETDGQRMVGAVRVFRNWRMIGEGCSWDPPEPFEHAFMVVDGKARCRVCGQERKPRK